MTRHLKTTLASLGFERLKSHYLIALVLIFLGCPTLLPAQILVHRYSFVSDASDSVGGPAWNGTLMPGTSGNPATIANGLFLPGNAGGGNGISGYVALPNGIVKGDTSVSVECWVQPTSVNTWAEIWDFGSTGSTNFALIQDSPGPGNMRVAFTPHGNEVDIMAPTYLPADSTTNYIVVTYNNSTLTGDLYTNAVLDGTVALPDTTYSPGVYGGGAGTTNNSFGNDVYGDPQFGGNIYEVRIWNGVVSQRYISASAVVGPSVLVTNLAPTSISVTGPGSVVVTGTGQASVTVQLPQTGTTNLLATADATNWISGNTNILTVNSNGLVSGVSAGTTTVKATVGGLTATSDNITVTPLALEHRYSFVSDASDSVGGSAWDGTLIAPSAGGSATISNGLFLPGNTVVGFGYSGYLSLPAGILVGDSSVTVECWATQTQANTWAELWDFGNSGSQNFGLIPRSGSGNTRVAFTPNGGEIDIAAPPLPTNAEEYTVVTYNNSTLIGDLYTNGVLDATQSYPNSTYSPGSIGGAAGTTENMLGNDVYGDQQFDGVVYEFRIWNGAVSPLYVALSAIVGPSNIVTNLTPSSVAVTVTNTSMVGAQTQQATVTASFSQGTNVVVTDAAINWTSSNPNVLSVSSSGLITGLSGGNATVSATVGGVTATSPSITVALTAPKITLQPVSVTTVVGESATFTVAALGGNLSYQWSEGATPIPGATNTTLTLTNLTIAESGNYSVLVTNALGTTNSVVVALTVDTTLLEHRYSFVSDASDSVGGPAWNGTIVPPNGGSAATITNGLNLPGANGGFGVSGYVSLPAGILLGTASISVECWLTQNQGNGWAEPWDFGNNGSQNFALIPDPDNNNGNMEVAFTPHGNEVDLQSASVFPNGVEQYVVVTFDSASLIADLYTNAVLDATRTLPDATYTPGTIGGAGGTVENMLGNDVYGDAQFNGTIYEFRIWNGLVSQRYISASEVVGPSVVITNLTPTSISVTGPGSVVVTGTGQASVTVQLPQTGTTNLLATGDATNWTSGNTNILTVNSSGLVVGVSPGTATVSATVDGLTATSGNITVTPFGLEHRYSFVSDASDSVGGAAWDGTIIAPSAGGSATISNGLFLPGNTVGGFGYSGYVSLPSGILVGDSSVTVECWMTENQANTWAEVWDFGNNGSQNFGLIPRSNTGNTRVAFTPNGGEIDLASAPLPTNAVEYVVVTYNNFTLIGDLYTNGVLDSTQTYPNTTYSPGSIGGAAGTTENMLGNDVYGDQQFDGTIYEFRIWNGAVSPLYVAVSAAAGPSNVVSDVTPLLVAVTVTNTNMIAFQSQQATVKANFSQGTNVLVTDAATNWTSSDTNVLSVSSSGLITGLGGGNATVSATVGGVTATSASIAVQATSVTLDLARSGANIVLTWPAGVLLQAPTLLGPWTTNNAAVSPYTTPTTGNAEFYKIQLP
jgi:uncharacterized protein YjdB